MSDFLSADDLARALGVCKSTVYHWVRKGKLPRPLRRKAPLSVWVRADVQRLIDECRGQPHFPFGADAA